MPQRLPHLPTTVIHYAYRAARLHPNHCRSSPWGTHRRSNCRSPDNPTSRQFLLSRTSSRLQSPLVWLYICRRYLGNLWNVTQSPSTWQLRAIQHFLPQLTATLFLSPTRSEISNSFSDFNTLARSATSTSHNCQRHLHKLVASPRILLTTFYCGSFTFQ